MKFEVGEEVDLWRRRGLAPWDMDPSDILEGTVIVRVVDPRGLVVTDKGTFNASGKGRGKCSELYISKASKEARERYYLLEARWKIGHASYQVAYAEIPFEKSLENLKEAIRAYDEEGRG